MIYEFISISLKIGKINSISISAKIYDIYQKKSENFSLMRNVLLIEVERNARKCFWILKDFFPPSHDISLSNREWLIFRFKLIYFTTLWTTVEEKFIPETLRLKPNSLFKNGQKIRC